MVANKNRIRKIAPVDLQVVQYPVYHYTTWENFEKIMRGGLLKGSLPHRCNDPFELLPSWDSTEELDGFYNDITSNQLLFFCLSRTARSALMWGHYAEGGRGVVLQFKLPLFRIRTTENDDEGLCGIGHDIQLRNQVNGEERIDNILLHPIKYVHERPKFTKPANQLEYSRLTSTKGQEWQFEQELRVVMNRGDWRIIHNKKGYFTREFNRYLSGIILGPKWIYNHHVDDLDKLLNEVMKLPHWEHFKDPGKKLLHCPSGVDERTYTIDLDPVFQEGGPLGIIPLMKSICLDSQDFEITR